MRRQGQYFQDARVLGMRMRPYLTEEIGFTDNDYYQAEDEVLVVDDNPDGSPIRAFEVDGFDNDADGLVDEPGESLAEPRGEVSEVFSNLVFGLGFELPVNTALVPLVGEGSSSVKVFRAEVNWIEYFKETDSPDAVNFNVHFDLPQLLKISKDVNRNTFYVRVEGDYANITDPLDVAEYQFDSVNPTLTTGGDRADFTRTEWFAQGTFGWKGPRFDAKVLARHYDFSVDDDLLNSADHVEEHLYAEVGHSLQGTEHRVYALGEYVIYDFDQRGPTDDASQLRNFNLMRGGLGWEGPFLSRKVRGKAEAYYVNQTNVDGEEPPFPFDQNGNPTDYPEYSGMGGLARLVYRPYVTKSTEFQVEVDRHVDWSVVAQYKIVTEGTFSMSHPISERLIADLRYTISNEDVVRREQRLYQEAGLKFRYRLMAYTELFVQYTYRTMDQKDTLQETFTDGIGEPFVIEPDGDFTANIASVGISINF
jgi:hypothetical protein